MATFSVIPICVAWAQTPVSNLKYGSAIRVYGPGMLQVEYDWKKLSDEVL